MYLNILLQTGVNGEHFPQVIMLEKEVLSCLLSSPKFF